LKEYRDYADTSSLEAWNESFVHEILKALRFGVRKVDEDTTLLYQLGSDSTITLCYSLLPSEDLDSTTIGRNWAEKIIRKLRDNKLEWGILTNGDCWRIYHTEEPTPYENYLEIDLKGIMDGEDVQQYQIFHKFMRAENFAPDKDGNCQFDDFKKESQERINYIEEELKNALKQKEEGGKGILSNICMGYVDYLRENEDPDFSDEDLRDSIYSSAMLYMFRLLFLFYAKARGLLKEYNQELFSDVLLAAQKAQEQDDIGKSDYSLWVNLRELFSNVDLTYNGGLFNPAENAFVEENRLSDTYLAPVIYFMTFYEDKGGNQHIISYRDMGVRHLGSLYEGLLEHKLFVAEEDTEVKITKKEIKFVPASKGGRLVHGKYVPAGQIYFGNDKGMRKASGSYYTPEYIVDYIVQNTVGQKLDEFQNAFFIQNKDTIYSLKRAINEKERTAFAELLYVNIEDFVQQNILSVAVLDPAMGSGHFLVNATSQISNFLTDFSNNFGIIAEYDTSTAFYRRRVVEKCIFGVDVNPIAVELAKLSLWILSMAKDRPLSFLDHHLKCGNSLAGAKLSEIGHYPNRKDKRWKDRSQLGLFEYDKVFKAAVDEAVEKYSKIKFVESRNLSNIGDKKQWLDDVNEILKRYNNICDFHTNMYFREDISEDDYNKHIKNSINNFLQTDETFFHWELEYPEKLITNTGFDIIIGNPPFKETKLITSQEKTILYNIYESMNDKSNYYVCFYELAIKYLLKTNGYFAFVSPPDWLDYQKAYVNFKEFLIDNIFMTEICELELSAFSVATNVYFFRDLEQKDLPTTKTCLFNNEKQNGYRLTKDSIDYSMTDVIRTLVQTSNVIENFGEDVLNLGDDLEIQTGISLKKEKLKSCFVGSDRFLREGIKEKIFISDDDYHEIFSYDTAVRMKTSGDRLRTSDLFNEEKIIIKRRPLTIIYDDNKVFCKSNCLILKNKTNRNYNLLYIALLLNSTYYSNLVKEYIKYAQLGKSLLSKIVIPYNIPDNFNNWSKVLENVGFIDQIRLIDEYFKNILNI